LRGVSQSVLLLWGEDDPIGAPMVAEKLPTLLLHAAVVILRQAGHLAWLDDPLSHAEQIRKFLHSLRRGADSERVPRDGEPVPQATDHRAILQLTSSNVPSLAVDETGRQTDSVGCASGALVFRAGGASHCGRLADRVRGCSPVSCRTGL